MVFKKRSGSPNVRSVIVGEALPPLIEGPAAENQHDRHQQNHRSIKNWLRSLGGQSRRSRIRALLALVSTSLGPFPVGKLAPTVCPRDTPIEASSAQYIVQQYIAATGGLKLHNSIHSAYAIGRIKVGVTEIEGASANILGDESGCFVLWQMPPDKWYVEVGVAGIKVRSGSNGHISWRQFLGRSERSNGCGALRPLRRLINGVDPRAIASLFLTARCAGERQVEGQDCFVLRITADTYWGRGDPDVAAAGEEEVIRHVAFGYFCQRSGFLVRLEDTQLTRVADVGGGSATYWEVMTEATMRDYRAADGGGVAVPHSGATTTSILRFGEAAAAAAVASGGGATMARAARTRIVEEWWIDDAAFNVAGLSSECFIPPSDLRPAPSSSDAGELAIVLQEKREEVAFVT